MTVALLTIGLASSQEPFSPPSEGEQMVVAYAEPSIAPPPPAAPSEPELLTISFQVQRGDTLAMLLATAGVDRRQVDAAVIAIRDVFDPKTLGIGNEITVALREDGTTGYRLEGVVIWQGGDSYVEATRDEAGNFAARRTSQPSIAEEPADFSELVHIEIHRGDTLATLLAAAGVSGPEIDRAVRALRRYFNPKKLRVDHEIFLSLDSGAELLGFALKLREGRFITVVRDSSGRFTARRTGQPTLPKASVNAGSTPETKPTESPGVAAETKPTESPEVARAATPSAVPTATEPIVAAPLARAGRDARAELLAAATGPNATLAIEKGDTLMEALTRAGSSAPDAYRAIEAFKTVLDPRRLQVGQRLTLAFAGDGAGAALAGFSLQIEPDRDILVLRGDDGAYRASEVQKPVEMVATRTVGTIETSLYVAAVDAGMPISVLMEMIRAFSFDVDFQREIQKGDSFEVLFDRAYTPDGLLVREGPMRYAALTLRGKTIELFRFELADGRFDYFDAKGQSVRKALMRTPIDGARLSSTYGMRKNPILGYTTMHRGVDFAAPTGTPIMAAGDGVIVKARRNGGYGKYVRIRHNSTYSTAYAHLSKYGPGIKEGVRVRQGDIIGYVGTTGHSTGPHLHYEVLVDNQQINPLSVKLPTGEQLAGAELARFEKTREAIIAELDTLPALTLVAKGESPAH